MVYIVCILYTFRPLSKRVVDVILCTCVAMGSAKCTHTIYDYYIIGISDYTMHCNSRTHARLWQLA